MTARRTAAATAALLAATVLSPAAPGAEATSDPTPGYSVRSITVGVRVGPDDQRCAITADLYRPDGVSSRRRAPAVLTTHGFGGSKSDGNQTAIARGFVQEGYVVLSYSGLGFGGSGCKIHLDDPDWDGRAGSQLVSVLAGTKTFTDDATGERRRVRYVARERRGDPRVGMIGGSYGGQIQYAVAMQDRRVDAIIPIITWHDLSYSLAPNNTGFRHGVTPRTPGVHKRIWTDLFFGAGIADGVDDVQVDPTRNVGCPNFTDLACAAVAELHTLGYPGRTTLSLARHASVATYAGQVTAPALIVGGQRDTLFNLQEAVATFRALRRHGTEARMVWQSWGHSGSSPAPGELDLDAESLKDSYLGRRFLAWMDRHVRGDRSVAPGPRFEYFRDWVRYDTSPARAGVAVRRAYARRTGFSQQPTASLYLTGDSGLTPRLRSVRTGSASYANTSAAPTSYSETSGVEGNQVNRPVSDTPGTFVAFTSRRLSRPADLVGSPSLTLHLDAPVAAQSQSTGPAGKLILFAKLYDVAPDGTRTLKNRLVSPVRVTDVTRPVRVQLPGVVHRFRAGHRLEVVVAASDFAYGNNTLAQPVTVTTSRRSPGVLRLPLTSGLRF
ncbi:MAG TPA: CocE/NonD family hydrolase [Nocardioidaceae bacterium]|nr:CocE/NonD family hydrolase [Nocardioidaceae bacterium]